MNLNIFWKLGFLFFHEIFEFPLIISNKIVLFQMLFSQKNPISAQNLERFHKFDAYINFFFK